MMKKMNKEMELSYKALSAAMFMGTVCLYMAIGAVFALVSGEGFNYHVSFAFLIQGVVVSTLASIVCVLCFGSAKSWSFVTRYLLTLLILSALFILSMLIPVIGSTKGHFMWVISGAASILAFGTAVAVLSNQHFKKTGTRSVLLWELK